MTKYDLSRRTAVMMFAAMAVLSAAQAADEAPPIKEPEQKPAAQAEPPKPVAEPAPAKPPAAPAAPAPTSGIMDPLARLKEADNLTEARAKALEALKAATNAQERKGIEDFLGEIALPLVFSKRPMPEKVEYTVVTGDTLAALAKKYDTTMEVIRKGNNIPGQVVRLGSRLRILNGKLSILVDKSDNTLVLTLNEQFFKRYRVGTGQYATTPAGSFKITGKVAQPTWYRPDGKSIPFGDKENLLGTHWMSIDVPGFGLHGTWEPDTIGKQSSQGCIRLLNSDIEELFTLVPEGTPVIIQD